MKNIFWFAALLILFSCSDDGVRLEEKRIRENVAKLEGFVADMRKAPMSAIPFNKMLLNELSALKNTKGIAMAYLVNSECSICIADCIRFLKVADRLNKHVEVFCILNDNHQALVEYYLEQTCANNLKNISPVMISVEQTYPFVDTHNPAKNIVILNDGNIVSAIGLSNNTLTFN
jgi:hypothetical protein